MGIKKLFFLVGFMGFFPVLMFLTAQQGVEIVWVEGKVEEQQQGNKWTFIEEGTTVLPTAILRLSRDTLVELRYGPLHMRLRKPGVYNLAEIISSTREAQKNSTGPGMMVEKIARLVGKDTTSPVITTTAGARGASAQDSSLLETMCWDEGERTEGIKEKEDPFLYILSLYAEGDYPAVVKGAQAIKQRGTVSPEEVFRATYWEAVALYAQDLLLPALRVLENTPFYSNVPEYGPAVFLKARLYMDMTDWSQALGCLQQYEGVNISVRDRQAALFLQALCYEGLAKKGEAKKVLEIAQALDPNSDVGQEISAYLKRM
ncbi:MAG TPA: tetratricopeptide repeat protein [Termitinemataceae bacterium]|uniref:tetratricopeptide repeat protein n=1 Tax=Treponema sp. J25 TaxID=2094121 RepID=UPI00104361A8|nr:tetratricopeptide repeat protein [Treponema sp. J25]TCW62064.1 hypothetical protein C5O22_03245 [Treponema sp. J25]HOJ98390.1 tetratricopeptide repeat protein [Termitinemataceae bacterium]HOM23512.1 tetratricopeptide repeat protein [Termitinemataceae bacterium]HPP99697.1 tetratricopeptide repeat protein [Termitinemataceae bacterium]